MYHYLPAALSQTFQEPVFDEPDQHLGIDRFATISVHTGIETLLDVRVPPLALLLETGLAR